MSSSSAPSTPRSLPPRVGHEARERARQRRDRHRLAQQAARRQVGAAVVVEAQHLGRGMRGALEIDEPGRRVLLPAVAGAELRLGGPLGSGIRTTDYRLLLAKKGDTDDAHIV